ncbi:fatty acyl-AMP ligase [Merismopedia glauca]|uniref:AMP-dependent synthetase n=1 Tax=Merismopedia glauca CCAP 1448/3 TaxID=1296344 RepID=A0A2T1C2L5_9CYAN|nr:fatty acyl-AMP ligase [Merismopedia glauca]PSB02444.1 AMP-dependent synthetase [Merismopedia glauca CCAP 1448/3]
MKQTNIVEILRSHSIHQPDRLAYTFLTDETVETRSLSYGELDEQVRAIAAALQDLGMAGERVLLLYPPGLEFISAFLGCLAAGVVAVPIHPPRRNRSMSRVEAIAQDAEAKLALTTASIFSNIEKWQSQTAELNSLQWLNSETLVSKRELAQQWQPIITENDTLAYLQYTSGSTSKPKGVMVSHGNVMHNSQCIQEGFELTPESVSVSWLPHFHDMGLIDGVIQPLYAGFSGFLLSPVSFLQQPIRWLQAISKYKGTHGGGPNFAYDLCTDKVTPEQLEILDLSSWCSAYSGAEPVRRATLERFAAKFQPCGFQPQFFYPCYGLAEGTLMVTGGNLSDKPVYRQVSADALARDRVVEIDESTSRVKDLVGCGRSRLDTQVAIAHPDSMTQCAAGEVGEIWIKGGSVTLGYWNRPLETEQNFQAYLKDSGAEPFFRTGDLGFIQNDELFITGRIKDVIIIRGRNHYPQDIELTVEQSHIALQPAASAAFTVEIEGLEKLVILQEVKRTYLKQIDVEEAIGNIRQAVTKEHELQVHAILLLKTQSIPKTSSGKIQRHACREQFLQGNLEIVGGSDRQKPQNNPNLITV